MLSHWYPLYSIEKQANGISCRGEWTAELFWGVWMQCLLPRHSYRWPKRAHHRVKESLNTTSAYFGCPGGHAEFKAYPLSLLRLGSSLLCASIFLIGYLYSRNALSEKKMNPLCDGGSSYLACRYHTKRLYRKSSQISALPVINIGPTPTSDN
jgi:hypothetical protein